MRARLSTISCLLSLATIISGCSTVSNIAMTESTSPTNQHSTRKVESKLPPFTGRIGEVYDFRMEREFFMVFENEGAKPRIVTVLNAFQEDQERLSFVVTASLPYDATPNGLPAKGELNRVSRIEDQIIEFVEQNGGLYIRTCDI